MVKAASREAAKLAQEAAAQRKKGLLLANKGKQKAPLSISSDDFEETDEEDDEEDDNGDASVEELSAPTPSRSRRSRPITLPKRFKS